ncbi:hypothetical protein [Reichenbachiella versicolor]|uniref:hypothetical protein n=1 Tax=Reichenbachiella versicolor TaxID=1821036 RepID=UPI000D6E3249|nr:hypothetical protein [Reichenbachiella versicolor]
MSDLLLLPPYLTEERIKKISNEVDVDVERVLLFYSLLMYRNIHESNKYEKPFTESRLTDHHQVHSSMLKIIFGRSKYRKTIEVLMKMGLLKINDSYSTGIQTDTVNRSGYTKKYKIPEMMLDVFYSSSHIEYRLKSKRVLKAKQRMLKEIIIGRRSTIRLSHSVSEILKKSLSKIDSQSLPRIARHHHKLGPSMDTFGNRIFSCITNIKSELRPEIRYSDIDEKLIEFDLKTSQLYMLANISVEWVECVLSKKDSEKLKPLIEKLITSSGFQMFRNEVLFSQDRDVYIGLAKHLGIERKEAKKLTYQLLFGATQVENQNVKEYFDKEYKGFTDIIDEIKSVRLVDLSDIKMYSIMAIVLQRMESKVVLEHVVKEAIDSGIDRILTVHDAWIIKQSQADRFYHIAMLVCERVLGTKPRIEIEDKQKKRAHKSSSTFSKLTATDSGRHTNRDHSFQFSS